MCRQPRIVWDMPGDTRAIKEDSGFSSSLFNLGCDAAAAEPQCRCRADVFAFESHRNGSPLLSTLWEDCGEFRLHLRLRDTENKKTDEK